MSAPRWTVGGWPIRVRRVRDPETRRLTPSEVVELKRLIAGGGEVTPRALRELGRAWHMTAVTIHKAIRGVPVRPHTGNRIRRLLEARRGGVTVVQHEGIQ